MRTGGSSKKVAAASSVGLAIAACAACCAPLIAPWIVAVVAAGGASLVLVGQLGLALAILGGAGFYIWRVNSARRQAKVAKSRAPASCGCATSEGGEAC